MLDQSSTSHPALAEVSGAIDSGPPTPTRPIRRHRLKILLGLTFVTIVLLGWFVRRTQNDVLEYTRLVSHTNDVLNKLHTMHGSVDAILLNNRTFFLTGQEEYLDRARLILRQLPDDSDRLFQLTSDNPQQQERETAFRESMRTFQERVGRMSQLYRTEGIGSIRERLIADADLPNSRQLHSQIQEMVATEDRSLKVREKAAIAASQQSMLAGIACLVLLSGGLLAIYLVVGRETRERQKSVLDIQKINGQLAESLSKLQQLTRDTMLVGTLGDYLQSCQTREEAFQLLARFLPELFPDASGSVSLMSERPGWLESVLSWGSDRSLGLEFHADDCWGLRRGRSHIAGDPESRDPVCRHIISDDVQSCSCTPMAAHGQTLGLLTLRPHNNVRLDSTRQRIASQVAEQMSMALANLNLREALRFQSERDGLTGLYNRRFMEAALERERSRSQQYKLPLAAIMIDLDHFKRFNDTWGHEAGDVLLCEFGRTIDRHIRGEDIACRYGGEEFCVILPGASVDVAIRRAEELCEATRGIAAVLNGVSLGAVTMSAGVAGWDGQSEQAEGLISLADTSLYRAKRAGRDRAVCLEREARPTVG